MPAVNSYPQSGEVEAGQNKLFVDIRTICIGFIGQQLLLPFNLMKMPLSNQQVFDKINGVTTIFNVFLIKVA
jgi:hypothetical protein